jgi:hypothetical protein
VKKQLNWLGLWRDNFLQNPLLAGMGQREERAQYLKQEENYEDGRN